MRKVRLVLAVAVSCAVSACGGGGGSGSGGPAPMPIISVSTGAFGFAPQQLGSTSAAFALVVSNTGTAPLMISAVQLTGTNTGAFAETNNCGTVAVGSSCTISLTFTPASIGPLSATLSIQSNATPAAPAAVGLSGTGIPPASWTTLTHAPPAAVQLCLLLTDASLMCQSDQDWYRLTPSNSGTYVDGTWSVYTSFPSTYIPTAYASAVLADGRVAFVGGEYTGTNQNFTLTNLGAIFDPVTKVWQPLAPPPSTGSPNHWQCVGDAPATVLADGRLAIGSKLYQDVTALDPTTLVWTNVVAPGKSDATNSEEGWTLLSDGSVFTLDVGNAPLAERLVLAPGATTGSWVAAGPSPVDLHTPTDSTGPLNAPGCPPYNPPGEMGPAMLMPNGSVFAIGANGRTALYSPLNSWITGPTLPTGLNVEDGPAAMLPNGHVLFGASPGSTGLGLQYFEFDGTQLLGTASPSRAASDATFFTSLLVLPTGQVLFVDGSTTVQIYTPVAPPGYEPGWAPTITSSPSAVTAGATYQITGTQLNGLTQGSTFGDESQNATNYPLVRITNTASGHVSYARTHNHSSMGVSTGSTLVSTSFDVPAVIESGAGKLQIVANGIPSVAADVDIN